MLGLSIAERDEILAALGDCPEGLSELREALVQEAAWRDRDGPS